MALVVSLWSQQDGCFKSVALNICSQGSHPAPGWDCVLAQQLNVQLVQEVVALKQHSEVMIVCPLSCFHASE